MRMLAIACLALAACDAAPGLVERPGAVTRTDGNTVIVSVDMNGQLVRPSGATAQQSAEAQRVCSLGGKRAEYVGYDVRSEDYGAGLTLHFFDLMFTCV